MQAPPRSRSPDRIHKQPDRPSRYRTRNHPLARTARRPRCRPSRRHSRPPRCKGSRRHRSSNHRPGPTPRSQATRRGRARTRSIVESTVSTYGRSCGSRSEAPGSPRAAMNAGDVGRDRALSSSVPHHATGCGVEVRAPGAGSPLPSWPRSFEPQHVVTDVAELYAHAWAPPASTRTVRR